MSRNESLPLHANGYAKNEATGEIVAVQIVDGKCFYFGGEDTEVIELGPQWKPVPQSNRRIYVVILTLIVCATASYLLLGA